LSQQQVAVVTRAGALDSSIRASHNFVLNDMVEYKAETSDEENPFLLFDYLPYDSTTITLSVCQVNGTNQFSLCGANGAIVSLTVGGPRSGGTTIVGYFGVSGVHKALAIGFRENAFFFEFGKDDLITPAESFKGEKGVWVHWSVKYQAEASDAAEKSRCPQANCRTILRNGQAVQGGNGTWNGWDKTTGHLMSAGDIVLGARADGTDALLGGLDEFRLWDLALTDYDIASNFQTQIEKFNNLVVSLTFDMKPGVKLGEDKSGVGNEAKNVESVASDVSDGGGIATPSVGGVEFTDDASSSVTIPSTPELRLNKIEPGVAPISKDFTLQVWVKRGRQSKADPIITQGNSADTHPDVNAPWKIKAEYITESCSSSSVCVKDRITYSKDEVTFKSGKVVTYYMKKASMHIKSLDSGRAYFVVKKSGYIHLAQTLEDAMNKKYVTLMTDNFGPQEVGVLANGGSRTAFYFGYQSDDAISFGFGSDDLTIPSGASGDKNLWTHWTATFNSDNKVQALFRNGEWADERMSKGVLLSSGPFRIAYVGDDASRSFVGALDEMRIFAKLPGESGIGAMSEAMITNTHNKDKAALDSNIVSTMILYLPFDDKDNLAKDASDFGVQAVELASDLPRTLDPGTSVELSGTGRPLTFRETSTMHAKASFSVQMWLKRSTTGTSETIFSKGEDTDNDETAISFGFTFGNEVDFDGVRKGGFSRENGIWAHWTITKKLDPSAKDSARVTRSIFRSDTRHKKQQDAEKSRPAATDMSSKVEFFLGSGFEESWQFSGAIDEFRFWNKALAASAIASNFGTQVTVIRGLVCSVTFDDQTGSVNIG
jgi:hypothetical protein